LSYGSNIWLRTKPREENHSTT